MAQPEGSVEGKREISVQFYTLEIALPKAFPTKVWSTRELWQIWRETVLVFLEQNTWSQADLG